MGSLLPYFHGARKLPTSALCLILPPIPPAETFPKRQQQVISQAVGGFVSSAPFPPGRWIVAEWGFALQLRAARSPREPWKSFAPGSLSPPVLRKRDMQLQLSPLRGCPRCAQGRGALALFRHHAFQHTPSSPEGNPTVASIAAVMQV